MRISSCASVMLSPLCAVLYSRAKYPRIFPRIYRICRAACYLCWDGWRNCCLARYQRHMFRIIAHRRIDDAIIACCRSSRTRSGRTMKIASLVSGCYAGQRQDGNGPLYRANGRHWCGGGGRRRRAISSGKQCFLSSRRRSKRLLLWL